MDNNKFKLKVLALVVAGLPFIYGQAYAAKEVDLSHQHHAPLQSMISASTQFKEVSRALDSKNTLHVRIKQTYLGYPVHGGDAIIHMKNTDKTAINTHVNSLVNKALNNQALMTGRVYQNLETDLAATNTALVFSDANKQQALTKVTAMYQHQIANVVQAKEQQTERMVYVDKQSKAHWAYKVSFYVPAAKRGQLPSRPNYIVDALTNTVYAKWDNIQTRGLNTTVGGGFGGNTKTGAFVYDGLPNDLAPLTIQRDFFKHTCYLKNNDVTVTDSHSGNTASYNCLRKDKVHNKVFWDGELGSVHGGFSPENDALFGGLVVKHMYKDWYNVPVLKNADGSDMMLEMVVHDPVGDNAYWDGYRMSFGDGESLFYPLTSLGVGAHEVSHGFTQQHSGLEYYAQSGAMNESFSDMAAQAAEFYAYGKNSWQIGPEIFIADNQALRYMDQPSKDCNGGTPGDYCSIDDASQYREYLDVHYGSGVYNHFFYLLGTSEGWDTRKAFDVMVNANAFYWIPSTDFERGACDVVLAAKNLDYDVTAIKAAFDKVKIDVASCV